MTVPESLILAKSEYSFEPPSIVHSFKVRESQRDRVTELRLNERETMNCRGKPTR